MSNATEIPENLETPGGANRSWSSVNVALDEPTCTCRLLQRLDSREASTQVCGNSEEVGQERAGPMLASDTPNPNADKPQSAYLAPAEVDLWGLSANMRCTKCATFRFDVDPPQERMGTSEVVELINVPCLRIIGHRLRMLVSLLPDAVNDAGPFEPLCSDSLAEESGAKVLERPKQVEGTARRLSETQFKEAMSYLEERLPARVGLATLARLAGLSQSHYSRAFKASTGLAPYQWQLRARIERAQQLLINTNGGLESIAEATGFADAVHFGRTFRKVTGATPAAWRVGQLK